MIILENTVAELKGSYGSGKQHQPVQCSRGNDGSGADSIFSAI